VVEEGTRAVDEKSLPKVKAEMETAGVRFVSLISPEVQRVKELART
jgi:hypothetical protein